MNIIQELKKTTLPFVVIDQTREFLINFDYVICDNINGAYMAVSHLIKLGHKNIGFIAKAQESDYVFIQRLKGYKKALAKHNLVFREGLIKAVQNFQGKNRLDVKHFHAK